MVGMNRADEETLACQDWRAEYVLSVSERLSGGRALSVVDTAPSFESFGFGAFRDVGASLPRMLWQKILIEIH